MKKIYSLLTMLLLATALHAATNLESSNLQVATVSATPDDGNQEGYYNLTVNVNATDTTLANIKILYRTDKQFDYYIYPSDVNKYTELTNHTPIALPRGNYYIALMSTKANSWGQYSVFESEQVQLTSDYTIDWNFYTITVDFDLPEGAEDRFYFKYNNVIHYNHSSFEVFEGGSYFDIYDKNNGIQISGWSCYVTSDQTSTIPFYTLTVSTNASEEVMNVSELRVYWNSSNQYNTYYYTVENNGSIVLPPPYGFNYNAYCVKLVDKDLGTVILSKEFNLQSDQTVTLNTYNLTANLNATNIDNYLLVYSSVLSHVTDYYYYYYEYGQRAATIENHGSISLGEGQKIYVGVYDKEAQKTVTYKEVVMDSDQTVDFDIVMNTLTVNLNASKTDNLTLVYSEDEGRMSNLSYSYEYYLQDGYIKTIENHASVSFQQGQKIYVGVYDNQSERLLTYREVVMDSDKTEDFKYNVVTKNITAPEEILNDISVNLRVPDNDYGYRNYRIDDYVLVTDGQYDIEVRIPTGEYNSRYINKTINITEDTSLDFKIDKLSIVCSDKNGEVAPDIRLKLTTNKSSSYDYFTTDNNGRVETYALEGDTIRISMEDNNFDVSNYIVIMNGNKDISLSVPNKISFKLYVDGKPSDDGRIYSADNQRMTYNSDEKGNYSLRYDGKFPLRLFVDGLFGTYFECDQGFVPGYFTPTDGCTVRVASVRVESDGKGLVFPRNDFRPQQIYKMFVDNVVRLAAIPVGNSEFINWEINGKTYSQPMIDYTVGEDEVTAIAHFSGEITTGVKGVKAPNTEEITVSIEGGTLRLPEFIEGDASFYSVDGRLVKQVGVVGDRIVISDLPAGAYVLTIGVEGRTLSARFVKP